MLIPVFPGPSTHRTHKSGEDFRLNKSQEMNLDSRRKKSSLTAGKKIRFVKKKHISNLHDKMIDKNLMKYYLAVEIILVIN